MTGVGGVWGQAVLSTNQSEGQKDTSLIFIYLNTTFLGSVCTVGFYPGVSASPLGGALAVIALSIRGGSGPACSSPLVKSW